MSTLCWNGVGLTTPEDWEPSALERDGFVMARGDMPLCELKWRVVHGSFSFKKHLKRLSKGNKGAEMRPLPEDETPDSWAQSMQRLEQSGLHGWSFFWKGPGHNGMGAMLHNPATGLAVLAQFFIRGQHDLDVASEVLSSFRDHSSGKTTPWTMFGLTARVPSQFVLDTFSFKPGHYRVSYWLPATKKGERLPPGKGKGVSLVFDRYAPASVFLKGTTLEAWVADNLEGAPKSGNGIQRKDRHVIWDVTEKTSLLRRVLGREVHNRGRAWIVDDETAVLGVHARGSIAVPADQFNGICESYGIV